MNFRGLLSGLLFSSLCFAADPALTLYNQRFAVVRETMPLVLKKGVNQVQFTGTTAQLEPESVMLRDPSGKVALAILEQNYRADPVSMDALMTLYEGKTIDQIATAEGKDPLDVIMDIVAADHRLKMAAHASANRSNIAAH